jgi:hypothetical protein
VTTPAEQKKAVCTGLTAVVRESGLAGAIDPKAFFMMLNSNYAALCREGDLDLNLLWDGMKGQHPPDALVPIFLRFEEVAAKLGLRAVLPVEVSSLSPADRAMHLRQHAPRAPARMPSPIAASPDVSDDLSRFVQDGGGDGGGLRVVSRREVQEEAPVALPVSALTPLPDISGDVELTPLPDVTFGDNVEIKKRLTTALVSILKSTPAGPYLKTAQISFFVATHYDALCDGRQFFFPAFQKALMDLEGVQESHLYLTAKRFQRWLARVGMELVEPEWTIPPEMKAHLDEQLGAIGPDVYTPRSLPSVGPPAGAPVPKEEKYGIGKKGLSPMVKRIIGYTIVAVAAGAIALALHPERSLDVDPYSEALPLVSAKTFEGKFIGTLDLGTWQKLSPEKRRSAMDKLTEVLKQQNRLKGARVVHPRTKSVIMWDTKEGKLGGMKEIVEDGDLPQPKPK